MSTIAIPKSPAAASPKAFSKSPTAVPKRKLSLAALSTRFYSLLHLGSPNNARELSVLQLKFALVIEHFIHQALTKSPRLGPVSTQKCCKTIVPTKELCLHGTGSPQMADFGWMQVPAFVCMGCLKPQRKRNVLGCRTCCWEVCSGCRDQVYMFFQHAAYSHEHQPLNLTHTVQTMVPAKTLQQVVRWAEKTNKVRPEIKIMLRDALAPSTAVFALCSARVVGRRYRNREERPAIAALPQELVRMVADMLGSEAAWSMSSS